MKPQEENIQIATKHQLHDSIFSTFYTDGSKSSGGVGAAYCQIKNQDIVHNDNIKLYQSNTIFQAEATAILECLLFIKSNDCYVAAIFSDLQSVLKSFTAFSKDPLITDIQHIYTEIISSRSITFYWCPGHADIFGNECADRFAKLAVKHGREATSSINYPSVMLNKY